MQKEGSIMKRFDYSFLDNGLLSARLINITGTIYSLKTEKKIEQNALFYRSVFIKRTFFASIWRGCDCRRFSRRVLGWIGRSASASFFSNSGSSILTGSILRSFVVSLRQNGRGWCQTESKWKNIPKDQDVCQSSGFW